jgi:hypothetical protein
MSGDIAKTFIAMRRPPAARNLFLFLLLVASAGVRAGNGREFSAMWDVEKVTSLDAQRVSVTLVLRLRNHSATNVSHVSIRLADRVAPGETVATLHDPLAIGYRASATVTDIVTVERSEYQRWLRGGSPNLVVEVIDARGRHVDYPVEMVRMPGAGAGS